VATSRSRLQKEETREIGHVPFSFRVSLRLTV
jgi:hypothetical protein